MRDASALTLDPRELDYSMFGQQDLRNIVLQRSEILHDVRNSGQVIKAWEQGDPGLLDAVIADKSLHLAERAVAAVRDEFLHLEPCITPLAPKKVADIGCGYAFFDLFAHAAFGADLLLVDIEENEHRHFGYRREAAAYASLGKATEFLVANGVERARISTWNPQNEDLPEARPCDLAVSLLSCGFHYPVDMYMPYFHFGVQPRGAVILDLRAGQFGPSRKTLSSLGSIEILDSRRDRKRVILRKEPKQ